MPTIEVAYLGPEGTYSNFVATKRFGKKCKFVPLPTILDVCKYVSNRSTRRGVIPIENSSGGAIYETVDILLAGNPRVRIAEEMTLNVRLALLGRKGERISELYSHFAPMEHCATWIEEHLPKASKNVVSSTAIAAQRARETRGAASIGNRKQARIYGLDVLEFPVQADIPNVTAFLAIGQKPELTTSRWKTTLAVKLPNEPGSLCTFLEVFRDEAVNLSLLISRPQRGSPKEYAFLVDIDGAGKNLKVKRAMRAARKTCMELRTIGSYPLRRPYTS